MENELVHTQNCTSFYVMDERNLQTKLHPLGNLYVPVQKTAQMKVLQGQDELSHNYLDLIDAHVIRLGDHAHEVHSGYVFHDCYIRVLRKHDKPWRQRQISNKAIEAIKATSRRLQALSGSQSFGPCR